MDDAAHETSRCVWEWVSVRSGARFPLERSTPLDAEAPGGGGISGRFSLEGLEDRLDAQGDATDQCKDGGSPEHGQTREQLAILADEE